MILEDMPESAGNKSSPGIPSKLYYLNTDFTWNDIGVSFHGRNF